MVRNIARVTGAVKYAHSENGFIDTIRSNVPEIAGRLAEQAEIEYLPRPVEEMADALVLGRWIIRNTAYAHGAIATSRLLEEGVAGNGLHFHSSRQARPKHHARRGRQALSRPALIGGSASTPIP
jgi:glutamine synthetase